MELSNPVTEIIKYRSSRRRYQERPIDGEKRRVLEGFLASGSGGPFGTPTRFELIAATEEDRAALKGLGTYGFIRGAPGFVVGAVETGPRDMEDYGFNMERIILLATDLELGTCWLGGTFNKSEFSRKIGAAPNETVPAVAAIGHHPDKRGTVEKLIRWGAKSKKRRPWERMFFSGVFGVPLAQETAGEFATALEMVRLGPSASNKQPWKVVKERGAPTYHFFLQRTPGYGKSIGPVGFADLQRIDMGIAMCHFELTARELGLATDAGHWVEANPEVGALPELTEYCITWQG